MTGDERPPGPALRRVLDRPGGPELLDLLAERVVRAQHSTAPGMLAHFQLFALVTAGRDTGGQAFEHEHLAEHLRLAVRALSAAGVHQAEIRLTCLDTAAAPVLAQVRSALAGSPGIDIIDDPDRTSGRGYYAGLCYKIYAVIGGQRLEIADGGIDLVEIGRAHV
jgi:hypothetical protein